MQRAQKHQNSSVFAFMPAVGTWIVLALALVPLIGMLFAFEHNATLFDAPPLKFSATVPLMGRTLGLAALVSVASLGLGTFLALLQVRYRYWGNGVFALMSTLPLAVPSYLLAAIVREHFAPRGFFGALLGREEAFTGFGAAFFVLTPFVHPLRSSFVAAVLRHTPASPEEAARTLGASAWRRFVNLTVPQLRPAWAFALVIVAFYVISDFGAVAVLDCEVLTWALYQARHAPADAMKIGFGLVACTFPVLIFIRICTAEAKRKTTSTRLAHSTPFRCLERSFPLPASHTGSWWASVWFCRCSPC